MLVTILIIENHDRLRWALRTWLQARFPDCHIIEAASMREAVAMIQTSSPHVVIMDTGLSRIISLEAIRCVKIAAPVTQILVLTNHLEEVQPAHSTANRTIIYLWKDEMLTELEPTLAMLLLLPPNGMVKPKPEPLLLK